MNLNPCLFLLLIFMSGVTENSFAQAIPGKFAPVNGKTMLFIGQDLGSIDGYINSGKFPTPVGVTMYTDIYSMAGLNTTINYGAGDIGLQAALDRYPNSALSVGLWMVEEADGEGEDHPNGLIEIVNGFHDNELIKFRDFAKRNAPRPIYLRIGYEFDGPWNAYNPTKYIAAYRYIVDYLNAQGVTNVAYVWQSAAWGENTSNIIDSYYPGDYYVDYVGLSFFFFNENFNGDNLEYTINFARNKNKPVMMAEVSAQYYEFDQGTFHSFDKPERPQLLGGQGIWDRYFTNQLIPFIDDNLDVIRAVAYINADWQSQPLWKWPDANAGFWGDTRIEKNNTISTNWSNYINNGNFLHGGSNLLNDLGVVNNPTCNDGIQNQGETGIDCGGFNCARCDTSEICTGSDIPSVTVTINNETSEWANDGSITFNFPNTTGRTNIEFSINNGSNYSYNVADNSDFTTVSNLSPGNYDLWVRWGNNECPQDLGRITIASGSYGDKDITAKLLPPNKKILLTIGQDLKTVYDYKQGGVNSKGFPEMGGTTTYIGFYSLLSSQFPQYGGLGETANGSIARNSDGSTMDVDWGAGPLNSRSAILGYENSSLSIGLSMTEGENTVNGVNYWCKGCLAQVGKGKWDNEIKRLATFFKKYSNKAIYLRIAYEFDGNWNIGYEARANYINAYRRIVDILRGEGVTNVAFVWQSSASPVDDVLDIRFGEGNFGDISSWYPGDNYVDWVGLSWFIIPDENTKLEPGIPTQRDKANEVVQFARSRDKPVYIAESTPQGYDLLNLKNCNISSVWDGTAASGCKSKTAAQIWNEWYTPFFEYIYVNKDVIRHVHYINTNWEDDTALFGQGNIGNGYWGRAGVQINNNIANKWKNEINKPVWLHGNNSLNSNLLNSRSSKKANQSLGGNVSIITSKPKISPNPSNDYIYIHTSNNQQINAVYILDINGRRINSIPKPVFKTSGDNMIDIRHLEQGIYFVTIKINQKTYIERLLIN